ncbi:glycosyl transferase [Rhodococcus hoagii]|uniref:Glycosyl transferase n=1 Tax=Rhodococcus hoagii TaxID=43767 RepID=A0AAE2W4C6_RHOHA|nr:glycosyltransferase family 39 protein [Prescottella equi]MBM4522235.1 glycosyl transferase [Prescottella equi]MBM4527967.1 glycosyl transferase [Prescottella equi]MBM4537634.1 glycosyl transferase [Prescottella equi]MBM4546335.1 glycosyl transferase [Prescottella equi]MBM4573093.1 glycosyl transferase [Prescottella equi]
MSVTIDRPVAAPEPAAAPKRPREYWALAALLVGTAVAYLWNLGASGWANAFYSAAVQAGSVSWKAFFFGSSDAANSITVDKPPASLWVMELSVRVFGLNSWSILVPQVLIGVASVALLWGTVRRYFGAAAGLLAGLVLALTPVAVLMFRFDNPDALLVLLMIAAVWATLRGVEDGRTRWMVLTGVFVGFGFLTKQLQVMLVVPPLALTYLIAGPPRLGKRVLQLFAALGGLIVSAGWWLLTVELWPADSRPWIGGSQNNSILELTLGYNGFGRLSGNERGSVGGDGPRGGFPGGDTVPGGAAGGGMWGSTGITRLFEPAQGGQIAWLLPAALVLLVAGIGLCGRAPRTDPRRASFVVWGSWLVVTGLVFSFMAGIFHAYYTVALAPAVAALVGAGAVTLWRGRRRWWVRIVAFAAIAVTASTAWILLARSPDFVPWLRWAVVVVGAVAAFSMVVPRDLRTRGVVVVIAATLFTGLAGPAAYAVNTIGTAHTGSIPSAGPRVEGEMGRGGPGGMPGPGEQRKGVPTLGGRGNGEGAFETPVVPGGFGGAGGGLLDAGEPGDELTALLRERADDYTWVAAAIGSNSAAGYQLATERPVMPIGGFNGSDPSPTLEQFQQFVADGRIHYFLAGGMGGRGGEGTASAISEWVQANFAPTTVDGVVLYDLTQ